MIEVQNLSKRYGSYLAVDDISFRVEEGEILGFLGPNGAGKTTTMNILAGYLSASAGVAKINGFDVLEEPNQAKACIGYLPEQPPLYLDMTVREYLDYVYDLKKCKLPRKEHIAEICKLVKIESYYNRLIKVMSKGYRQRVGLAQALVGKPPILILDEPTVGLDPNQIIEIRRLIRNLGKEHTVILSSHILQEIEATCDRIIIINNGVIVADDTTAGLTREYSKEKRIILRVAGSESEIARVLESVPGVKSVSLRGEREPGVVEFSVEPEHGEDIRKDISMRLASRNWPIMEMRPTEKRLEDVFLQLTQGVNVGQVGTKGGNN